MTLPKPKKKKLISRKEFIKLAKKVEESFQEELRYLRESRMLHGNNLPTRIYTHS